MRAPWSRTVALTVALFAATRPAVSFARADPATRPGIPQDTARRRVASPVTALAQGTGLASRLAVRTLPDVTGKPVREALDSLAWTRLPVVELALRIDSVPAGTVVRQSQPAGTPVTRVRAETLWVARRRPTNLVTHIPSTAFTTAVAPPATTTGDDVTRPPPNVTVSVTSDSTHPPIDVTGIVVQSRTKVPDLVRDTPAQVTAMLRRARLIQGQLARDYSDDVPAGLVYRQHPPALTEVLTNTPVDLWYSIGPHPQPPTIVVPRVIGLSLQGAIDSLRRVGLLPGHLDRLVQPRGRDNVIDQKPAAGWRAHRGDPVDLAIAVAPRRVRVPPVTGLTRRDAELRLKESGLGVGRVTLVSVRDRGEVIVGQSPGGGQPADSGSLVDLVENRRAETRQVTVPDLTGLTLAAAENALRAVDLFLGEVIRPTATDLDRVVRQVPRAGGSAYVRTTVDVTLGAAGTDILIPVPDVTTLRTDSAQRLLVNSGFTRLAYRNAGGALTSGSVVLQQDPQGGQFASPASLVRLVVGEPPPPPPPVPDIVGLHPDDAQGAVAVQGLRLTIGAQVRQWRLSPIVMSQAPAPPAPPPPDGTITATVAIPVVPPFAAAAAGAGVLLVGVGSTVRWRIRKRRPPDEHSDEKPEQHDDASHDPPRLAFDTRKGRPEAVGGDPSEGGLVQASLVLRVDVTREAADAGSPPETLIRSWSPRDA